MTVAAFVANECRDEATAAWGTLIDTAAIPGGGYLHLRRWGEDYEILFGDEQLMGSWCYRSEQALSSLVAARLRPDANRVLIGGLGMGFTLAAARSAFTTDTQIVVAELVPQVVRWAEGPLAHLFGTSLTDARVSIDARDVHDVIVEKPAAFDAILLDVDNGPDGLISLANERLYCSWGLRAAHAALRSGGVLAVWSAYQDDRFRLRLEQANFDVEEVVFDAPPDADENRHVIWLARRRD